MLDFLATDAGHVTQMLVMLFYWVPFALAAYLVDVKPEQTRRWLRSIRHPRRHGAPERPMTPQHA